MDHASMMFYDDIEFKIVMNNMNLNIFYVRLFPIDPSWIIENHCHSSYELHYICEGKGIVIVNGERKTVCKGDFYLTGPGVYHEQISSLKEPMVEYCINFDYEIKKNAQIIKNVIKSDYDCFVSILSQVHFYYGKDAYDCISLFDRMFDEFERKEFGYYTSNKNYLCQIIINTLRCMKLQENKNYDIPLKSLDDSRHLVLDKIFTYEHYNLSNLNAGDVAKRLKISTRQLDRIVKKFYGSSFKATLLKTKLDSAVHLLKYSDLSVQEIASKLDFCSASYFSSIFKQKIGISPVQLRLSGQQSSTDRVTT